MKLIVTDCDGVLLDWVWGFEQWMKKHGFPKLTNSEYSIAQTYGISTVQERFFIKCFNESLFMLDLAPLRDAVSVVEYLYTYHGIRLHVITSFGSDHLSVQARTTNLHNIFGKEKFYRIDCIDPSESKATKLKEYTDNKDVVWIEDHPNNYELGIALNIESYLMQHEYNDDYTKRNNITPLKNWVNLKEMIL